MQTIRRDRILLSFFFVASFFIFGDADSTLHAQGPERVEVIIRNFAYEVQGGTLPPGVPATIVLRNLDRVEHGFVSPFFQEVDVQVESGGATTFGRGIKGVHLTPEKEIAIRFIPPRAGKFTFNCDIHPNMKGEVLLLSVGAA
ncbi:cupredoxin domain-containing protein [Candidatus Manganitrophus noduliformans]|uniref:EfeO-type cupredoxin-like domain-containing protein n=1 Tax=Candidatus Manganitrophus noduliformans TaxID=2606439 RepID=A0A7X6DMA4_9BACT|nr:cupredoxin domain-containing protein [Candidatus Manganitrophus noduliformans]NKE69764.1 hypothetical protein [Candidatus Manganitrophus noduliformans]